MRIIFDKWSNASNGAFNFIEMSDSKTVDQGIYIFLLSKDEIKKSSSADAAAFTITHVDNSGYIKHSFIYLPDDPYSWGLSPNPFYDYPEGTITDSAMIGTMSHEVGHALGLDLNHSEKTLLMEQQLNATVYGKFCSTMTYSQYISAPMSSCASLYPPPDAVYPGPLDVKMINTLYSGNFPPLCFSSICFSGYLANFFCAGFDALLMSFLFHNFLHFTRSFTRNNMPVISKRTASLIASTALSTFLATGYLVPTWIVATLMGLSLNDLPKKYINKLTQRLISIIQYGGNQRLLILSLLLAINRGFNPLALPAATFSAGLIGYIIQELIQRKQIQFDYFGKLAANVLICPLKNLAACHSNNSASESTNQDISSSTPTDVQLDINLTTLTAADTTEELPSTSAYQRLETPRRRSCCSWFSFARFKSTETQNQDEHPGYVNS